MNSETTKQPSAEALRVAEAFIKVTLVLRDAIREAGSIPSGHLYAMVMGHINLDTYTFMIQSLKQAGVVKEQYHLLTWVGPAKVEVKS